MVLVSVNNNNRIINNLWIFIDAFLSSTDLFLRMTTDFHMVRKRGKIHWKLQSTISIIKYKKKILCSHKAAYIWSKTQ